MGIIGIGKLLIAAGLLIAAAGAVLVVVSRFGLSGLPGDIRFNRGNFTFFFPIATSLLVSVILTILLNLILRFRR